MTHRERIDAATMRAPVDRVPALGGWITSAAHYQEILGIGEAEFWGDPESSAVEAYKCLGVDGLIDLFIPPHRTVSVALPSTPSIGGQRPHPR